MRLTIKQRVRPFIPPIVWSAMARLVQRPSASRSFKSRGFSEVISNQNFSISFHRVSHSNSKYFVPEYAEGRPASKAIISGELYEPETHQLITEVLKHRPGDLIHAGTFFGDMLPTFSRACPGTVYAFEPVLENYILSKICIQENNLENIFILNAGLGDNISIARIDTGRDDETHRGGASSISSSGQLTSLISIDSLCLDDVAIIQLDVEGYELNALRGAKTTISNNAPVIMIEDNNRECGPFLKSLDYNLAAEIPGLSVWSLHKDMEFFRTFI